MVISNVKIYTMDENIGIIEHGYVAFEDGKITAVGEMTDCPVCCDAVDGEGGWLLPGLIDGHTHLGICEDSLGFEGDDVNEGTDPVSPQLRAMDGINPFDRCFAEAREGGVTCVAVAPGSANPIGGQIAVLKTAGRVVDSMLLRQPAAIKFALGENPKSEYHSKNQGPETRMSVAALIRESLYKAKRYAEDKEKAAADKLKSEEDAEGIDEPDYDIKHESLIPLLSGEVSAHFHAHRGDDICTALRICREFGVKCTLVHCTEGYLLADELGEAEINALVGPNLCDRSKPELRSLSFENPAVLSRAGVQVGITTDHPVIPLQYLPLCAALAVKSGMDYHQALRGVTIVPAEILGVSDRVGSITPGKDADLTLFDGDPMAIMTAVKQVYIDGKRVK